MNEKAFALLKIVLILLSITAFGYWAERVSKSIFKGLIDLQRVAAEVKSASFEKNLKALRLELQKAFRYWLEDVDNKKGGTQ